MSDVHSMSDEKILDSWKKNAAPWINAIQHDEISSRVAVTNQAICDAVFERAPSTVLDVGCGEGWLVRALTQTGLIPAGIEATGVDAVPALIDFARRQGGGRFEVLAYQDVSFDQLQQQYDVVVCNFSLLGEASVDDLFQRIPALLAPNGAFIVQTIHPVAGCGDGDYKDGWRQGSWAGFSDQFCQPAPWYFRTIDTWKALFAANGFVLSHVYEPINTATKIAASIIFVAELANE